ncbi:citrate transporter [Propioniciclava sp. MC1683]|uniref:citrate:proton symporter n=1 Tax=Propioniciclava sp. MC1683 TaxID=2760309 RepID=UPI00160393F9|nr:citrate:proton symporter [Propioniciclava sp. MC1683]MBB1502423.1 citrate transporter [Propioniciclava sp. MC1683]
MLTILGLAMIVVFIALLAKKKLQVFVALTLVPLVFGFIAAAVGGHDLLDVFTWIQHGVFFKLNPETGKVAWGVIAPAVTILFSIFYFDLMLNVGLFDPVAKFFIKQAKGDPLKVVLSTVAVASVVSLNGDTTTTIIICLAAFRALYQQLNLSMWVLAIIIVAPIGIWNQLPWGGPTIAAAAALGVDLIALFRHLLPGLLAAQVVVIIIAWRLGLKERKRLAFDPRSEASVGPEHIAEMLQVITDKDPHLKRPKLFWVNLAITMVGLTLLIMDLAHGAVVFLLLSAIGLVINFPNVDEASTRIEEIAPDVLPTAIATLGAGVFSGVLTGSGMAAALAGSIAAIIPTALGSHMAPVYAIIATPAIIFLPQDAFYFGIASVLSGVMGEFGITPMQAAVASMVGQSFRLISPVIPALYLLCGETNQNFVSFQKKYLIWFWPILVTYLVVYGLTGAMPY